MPNVLRGPVHRDLDFFWYCPTCGAGTSVATTHEMRVPRCPSGHIMRIRCKQAVDNEKILTSIRKSEYTPARKLELIAEIESSLPDEPDYGHAKRIIEEIRRECGEY